MPRGELLGSLEYIVLLALVRLGPDAYGMTVRREIEARAGRNLSIGEYRSGGYRTVRRISHPHRHGFSQCHESADVSRRRAVIAVHRELCRRSCTPPRGYVADSDCHCGRRQSVDRGWSGCLDLSHLAAAIAAPSAALAGATFSTARTT